MYSTYQQVSMMLLERIEIISTACDWYCMIDEAVIRNIVANDKVVD